MAFFFFLGQNLNNYTYWLQVNYNKPKICFLFLVQIGPNVSISANVRVGPGARLISCIILDDVEIKVRN